MTLRIPLAKPDITDADRKAVLEVLNTPHLSTGPKVKEFEDGIAAYVGSPYAVAVNSGTSALHLAIRVLDIPAGSEVILPSFTFGALLNVLLQEGLHPTFVDIDQTMLNTTPALVEAAVTPKTKAIIAVHTFGRPVEIDKLREIADHHGIPLIEDACEALGGEVHGRKVGSCGDLGLFAFYPNKQITTGEGGVLVTADRRLADRAARLRNQGRDPALDWHQHSEIGYSYRISDLNCALGVSQLHRIESILERRAAVAETYDRKLADFSAIVRPKPPERRGRASWFCYVIQLAAEFGEEDRNQICESLTRKGIGAGRYFAPLHRQPVLAGHPSVSSTQLPVTDYVASRVLALPFFNQMTEAEIDDVCSALRDSLAELSGRRT